MYFMTSKIQMLSSPSSEKPKTFALSFHPYKQQAVLWFLSLINLDCKVLNSKICDSEFKLSFPEVNLLLALPE